MSRKALLIDYEYCIGCSACETACMNAHPSEPDGCAAGIKVMKLGPLRTSTGWQYDFVPIPTDCCTLCEDEVAKGARPACARKCQYGVIKFGEVGEMESYAELKRKIMLFTR